MSFFLLLNIKDDILKNIGNKTLNGPYFLPFKIMEVNDRIFYLWVIKVSRTACSTIKTIFLLRGKEKNVVNFM